MNRIAPASLLFALTALTHASADTLSLHRVLTEALENNPGHLAAGAETRFAESAHSSAGMAGYLPRLNASGGYNWSELETRQERAGGVIEERDAAQSVSRTVGINARWTLFEGFSAPLTQKRLRLQRDQARASEHLSREELLRRAALGYANLARQTRLLQARDTVLEVSDERVRILDRRLESGTAGRPEWLEGQVDRNADRAARIQQEAVLHAARLSLAQALGRGAAVTESPDGESLPSNPLDPALLTGNLAERQPLLQLAEADRELARVALRQAMSPWYPRLEATAGYNYSLNNNDAGIVLENRTVGPTAGLQLTVNLFDGELPWRVARRGRMAVSAADLRLREIEFAAHAEVERAHAAWRALDSAATLEREGLEFARENLHLTRTRWESGTLSYLEARMAQVKYLEAFTRTENAIFEAFRARLDLLLAAGRMEMLLDEAAGR